VKIITKHWLETGACGKEHADYDYSTSACVPLTDYFGRNSAKIQGVMIDEVGLNKSPELNKYLLTNN
jgi:hypothetical protein